MHCKVNSANKDTIQEYLRMLRGTDSKLIAESLESILFGNILTCGQAPPVNLIKESNHLKTIKA